MSENVENTVVEEKNEEIISEEVEADKQVEKTEEEKALEAFKQQEYNNRIITNINSYIVQYYVKNDELPDLDRLNKLANALY